MLNILQFPPMVKKLDNPPNRLREWRKARKMTQDELGDITGMSASMISWLEIGRRELSLSHMRAFARVLGVTVADLLNADDNPHGTTPESQRLIAAYQNAAPNERAAIMGVAENLTGFKAQSEIKPFSPPPAADDTNIRAIKRKQAAQS